MSKCPVCKATNCGDDYHTLTSYRREKRIGDRLKVILLQVNDMVDIDNLQVYEIKALIGALIDEHVSEQDG